MIIKATITLIISIVFTYACLGQIVKGQVRSEYNNQPISDVFVAAFIHDMVLPGVYTDKEGFYTLKIAVGKYQITANHISYTIESQNIETENIKDTIIVDFILKGGAVLDLVEISYVAPKINTSNVTTLKKKDFNVLPGSFDDPTRLLLKYPAISTVNDQANSVVYRGLPSHYMQWQLNGQEIVNPNHTSNAGTLSDLFSSTSGGVNMLGGQALESATFYGNPNSKSYNSISGVNDLETSLLDDYIQLSLLGLETGISYKGFSIGTRYSFTGLLGDLGVDFGGEEIRFEDYNFRYQPKLKKGKLLLTAVYGESENEFNKSNTPTALKEFQDIKYNSSGFLSTLNFELDRHKIGLTYSSRSDNRFAIGSVPLTDTVLIIDDISNFEEYKTGLNYSLNLTNDINLGLNYQLVHYKSDLLYRTKNYTSNAMVNLIGGFLNYNHQGKINALSVLLNPTYRIDYKDFSPDFHVDLGVPLSKKQSIDLNFGHSSQTQPSFVHLFSAQDFQLKSTKALSLDLAFISSSSPKTNLEFHTFYHLIYSIPQTALGHSAFNNLDLPPTDFYTLSDQAKVAGVSGQAEFNLPANSWLNTNVSLFQSSYRTLAVWVPSVQSFGHTFNASIGKLFTWGNNSKFLRIGMSFHHRGGSKVYPLNKDSNLTQFDYRQGPTETLANYYRLDFRVSYQKTKSTWSLDIQNVTSRKNQGYYFIDQPSGQRTLQSQLGLIPVLSYKLFL